MKDPEVWYSPSKDVVYHRAPEFVPGGVSYYVAGDDVLVMRSEIPQDARPMYSLEYVQSVFVEWVQQKLREAEERVARRDRDA